MGIESFVKNYLTLGFVQSNICGMKILPINNYNTNYQHSRFNNGMTIPGFTAKKIIPTKEQHNELRVFLHHIYEYKKGLRSLILTTEKKSNELYITQKLKQEKIPYFITPAGEKSINVFFGNEDCIKVVSTFDKKVSRLSPEKDFMLGILLGYDKILQCKRYMQRLGKATVKATKNINEKLS